MWDSRITFLIFKVKKRDSAEAKMAIRASLRFGIMRQDVNVKKVKRVTGV